MKLTDRIFEAIDLDGHDLKGARAHVRSKSILNPVLDRMLKQSGGMLRSLGLSRKLGKELSAVVTVLKDTSNKTQEISDIVKAVQGLKSLKVSKESAKVKELFKSISKNLRAVQKVARIKTIDSISKKQLISYISNMLAELEIIKKEVIKDL